MKSQTFRHSLSHVLALAVLSLYPKAKLGIGPAIENGFYYDFDLSDTSLKKAGFGPEDLPQIEKKMHEILNKNISFKKRIVDKKEVKKIFKNQPYKLELIKDLKEKIIIYESDNFVDLCEGPHVKNSKDIPVFFKLIRTAGAYWRGDEKNPMLSRIYGVSFESKKELDQYFNHIKEAEKKDHRLLGQNLDLFSIDEKIGPGLILWHPKGALLKKIIENYALNRYLENNYHLVSTPHIAKLNLWETSGHTKFYKENMFPAISMKELNQEEKDDYQIKPMNCPFHIAIYKNKVRSYKEFPIRYTEIGVVYRYEKSGTLHGLTRVRGISQDDAHIFCTPQQLPQELKSTLELTFSMFKDFGFKELCVYLSTRPKEYVGSKQIWQKSEKALKEILNKLKIKYQIEKEGGAFYGPKIDIKIKDSIGREWQCTTIQVDFNLPERFDITYIDEKGQKKRPIMVHRALLGAMERFIGVLLEYHEGNLPFWLSPEQLFIIPIGEKQNKYAHQVAKNLKNLGYRVKIKNDKETLSKKIREGEMQKIPYLLILGDKEKKSNSISVRKRKKGDLGMIKLDEFVKMLSKETK